MKSTITIHTFAAAAAAAILAGPTPALTQGVLEDAQSDLRYEREVRDLLADGERLDGEVEAIDPNGEVTAADHPQLQAADLDRIFGFETRMTVASVEALAAPEPAAPAPPAEQPMVAQAEPTLDDELAAEIFGEAPSAADADADAAARRAERRRQWHAQQQTAPASATERLLAGGLGNEVDEELRDMSARTQPRTANLRRPDDAEAAADAAVGSILGSLVEDSPKTHRRRVGLDEKRSLSKLGSERDGMSPADLRMAAVRSAVKMAEHKVKSCYGSLLVRNPDAQGSFTAKIEFKQDGTVGDLNLDMAMDLPASFAHCVQNAIGSIYTVRPLGETVQVEVPFALRVGVNSL